MNNGPNVDDYLKQGIYGKKEINPEERKKFLGTLRERIVAVLTVQQVYEPVAYQELDDEMRKNPQAKLLLNGAIPYEYLKKYSQMANKRNIAFTIVDNKDDHTDIGLVLTYDYAIDKEEIYITKQEETEENVEEKDSSSGLKGFLKKLF